MELFNQLESALGLCVAAETVGDYNDVGYELDAASSIIERIQGRVNELAAGLN